MESSDGSSFFILSKNKKKISPREKFNLNLSENTFAKNKNISPRPLGETRGNIPRLRRSSNTIHDPLRSSKEDLTLLRSRSASPRVDENLTPRTKSLSPRVTKGNFDYDNLNKNITESFYKMKDYYNQDTVTALELLNLKFYISMTEPNSVNLFDREPSSKSCGEQILAVFLVKEELYAKMAKLPIIKIERRNKFITDGYEDDSYDRLTEAIKGIKNHYTESLGQISYDRFSYDDNDKGCEILSLLDKERLFSYLTSINYVLKASAIRKWPVVKSNNIQNYKPEELLNKFWKHNISHYLKDEFFLKNNENIKILLSSANFLLEYVSDSSSHLNFLQNILSSVYLKFIDLYPHETSYYYLSAKYLTALEQYLLAWTNINRCDIDQHFQSKDTEWLKQLKIYHLTYLMKSNHNDFATASDYIKLGLLTQKLSNDILEICNCFLEGLIMFYNIDKIIAVEMMKKWDSEIIFQILSSAYFRSNVEINNQCCLLSIACECSQLLRNREDFTLTKDDIDQIILISSVCPQTDPIISVLKFMISSNLAFVGKVNNLYFSALMILFQCQSVNEKFVARDYFHNYENSTINFCMINAIQIDHHEMAIELTDFLLLHNYKANYLEIYNYLKDKGLYKLAHEKLSSFGNYIDNYQELLLEAENNLILLNEKKEKICKALVLAINAICENINKSEFQKDLLRKMIDNWITCHLITEADYQKIVKNRQFYQDKNYDFVENNEEYPKFVIGLYQFFELSIPKIDWIADQCLSPDQFFYKNMPSLPRLPRKNSASSFCKADGKELVHKEKDAVLSMIKKGKTAEEISFIYSIPVDTVDKIVCCESVL